MSDENYEAQQTYMHNLGYNTPTSLQLRLNPETQLMDFEYRLRGKQFRLELDENGKEIYTEINMGKPKCNEEGIQGIIMFVRNIINTQTVQGNIDREQQLDFVADCRESLVTIMIDNHYNWDLKENEVELIIDSAINCIDLFTTRPIGNLERTSYASTIKSHESNSVQNRGFSLNPFKGGG